MKRLSLLVILLTVLSLQYCSTTKRAGVSPVKKLTYLADIKPLVQTHCSPCHTPGKGKFQALNSYASMSANIDSVLIRIQKHPGEKGFMPLKKQRLSDSTINVFKTWKEHGLLEGQQ